MSRPQDADTGAVILADDWEYNCSPPPTLYIILEKVWPELQVDAMEDPNYVGEVVMIVSHVPTEVGEDALRKWLNTGLDEHTVGLHDVKTRIKALETELVQIEDTLERLATEGLGLEEDAKIMKEHQEKVTRMDFAHIESLYKLLKAQEEQEAILLTSATQTPGMYTLRKVGTHYATGLNIWAVDWNDVPRAQQFSYFATHKYDWNLCHLAVNRITGAITVPASASPTALSEVVLSQFSGCSHACR